jgi:iron(III) transport system substrate-binding protein
MKGITKLLMLVLAYFITGCGSQGGEKTQVVNVYTHRHYETDQQLFDKFTEQTGIKVNVVSASADELIQKLELEGAGSPADVLITVDAGRLVRAEEKGLLQAADSEVLKATIPEKFRSPENYWFGLTYRARVLVYHKDRVQPSEMDTYEDLVYENWKGRLLTRSSENIYNQSLLASIIAANGAEEAASWASGVLKNLARSPKGNDRDQITALAAGEGDVAIVNTYYLGIMLNDKDEQVRSSAEQVKVFFPNQQNRGTHINISGAAITKYAPNKENGIKLIEFLSSVEAQELMANSNYEYPVNPSVAFSELLESWGTFKSDDLNLSILGKNNAEAVKIFDKVGWK